MTPRRVTAAAAALLAGGVSAQEPPRFAKAEDLAKAPEWTASVTAGFGAATGNAQNVNFTAGANVGRRFGENLLTFDASAAIARSTSTTAVDLNTDGSITPDEVLHVTQTTSQAWATRLRYDRFFDLNAVYALGFAGGDEPAGKKLLLGAQAGYSRALYKTATSELVAELGFDFTHQVYSTGTPSTVEIASLRAYLGYVGNPDPVLSYNVGVEYLGNLNTEDTPTGKVSAFGDNRVNGKLGLTWKVFGNGSLGFRFRALYDSAPAPKPPPPGFSWAPGYQPLAEKLDTFSELVLVYKLM
jgi:hypothetical protein